MIESTIGKGTNVRILLPLMPKTKKEEKLRVAIADSLACVREERV
jgi:hypothetical protein